MAKPSVEIGRRLRAARERSGTSQGELAKAIGVTQTAVSYWEAGRRLPGVEQLMTIAAHLEVPLATLLPNPEPVRPVGAVLRAVAEQIDDQELAERLVAFAEEAAALPAPAVELRISSVGARDAAEQLLAAAGIGKAPVDVEHVAHRCGVRVLVYDFNEMIDGLVIQLSDGGAAIGLELARPNPQRRRFTLAHELGHHLLGHTSSFHVDFHDAGASQNPGYNWRHERAANEFAANLLMPAAMVREAFTGETQQPQVLAEKFDVSKAAMGFRLTSLGLRPSPME